MEAVLSDCRNYRYSLSREVDNSASRTFAFFGINPSTADESVDDATVRKWIGFAKRNNCKKFIVGNVFAYRATNVNDLAKAANPHGADNDAFIDLIIDKSDVLIPCWGSRGKLPKNLRYALDDLLIKLKSSGKPVLIFGKTKSGDPKHPLMLGYNTNLQELGV